MFSSRREFSRPLSRICVHPGGSAALRHQLLRREASSGPTYTCKNHLGVYSKSSRRILPYIRTSSRQRCSAAQTSLSSSSCRSSTFVFKVLDVYSRVPHMRIRSSSHIFSRSWCLIYVHARGRAASRHQFLRCQAPPGLGSKF